MTITREEYAQLRYETDDSNPLFVVGQTITIPDIPSEGQYRGMYTYGKALYHDVGVELSIDKMKYSTKQKQHRYHISGWWYLEMDLIGHYGDLQPTLFKLD